jgi:ribosomal protein L40E
MKLKRGQKLCGKCNQINGARAYTCKHCGESFEVRTKGSKVKKKRVKKLESISWSDIEVGQKIKVMGRSGTYYINQDGEKTYMSDPGIYTVLGKDVSGLRVYGKSGYSYVYMGPEKQSPLIPNMYNAPHNIMKVNVSERLLV